MDAKTYIGITPEKFGTICLTAKALSGLDISGTLQGQASAKGVTISWSYDPNANTLTLQCLQKPWYVAASIIESKLDDLVAGINRGKD